MSNIKFNAYDTYCGTGKVYTEIPSDAQEFINITKCDSEACFKRNITYGAPMEAIRALIEISEGGRQEFKVHLVPRQYL